jgi:hypothetical protein
LIFGLADGLSFVCEKLFGALLFCLEQQLPKGAIFCRFIASLFVMLKLCGCFDAVLNGFGVAPVPRLSLCRSE